MVVGPSDISRVLVERIEFAYPEPAQFSASEIDEWPPGILEHLVGQGILRPFSRASALCCPGCDWQCHKPILVRKTIKAPIAYIACDEEPDHGLILVPLYNLPQYMATLAGIASVVAQLMTLGPPRSSLGGAVFTLGTIKGRCGPRDVSVGLDDGLLTLRVGRQRESLVRILRWIDNRAFVDAALIRRLASRKERESARAGNPLDRSRQRARGKATQLRNGKIFREAQKQRAATSESWSAIAVAIAAATVARAGDRRTVSAGTVRRIIAEMLRRERKNFRSKRKSRL